MVDMNLMLENIMILLNNHIHPLVKRIRKKQTHGFCERRWCRQTLNRKLFEKEEKLLTHILMEVVKKKRKQNYEFLKEVILFVILMVGMVQEKKKTKKDEKDKEGKDKGIL